MNIVDKIDSLIKMIEIRHKVDSEDRDICYAHDESITVDGEEKRLNICDGINCSDCIFRYSRKNENIQALEDLKKLATLNKLITPTK